MFFYGNTQSRRRSESLPSKVTEQREFFSVNSSGIFKIRKQVGLKI